MSAFCQYIRSHHRLRHPAISAGSDGLFEEQWCLSHDAFLFRGAKVMRIFRSSKTLQELQTSQSNASSGNYSRANIFDHRIRYWLFRIDIRSCDDISVIVDAILFVIFPFRTRDMVN